MGHTPLQPCPLCGREPELLEHEDGLAQNGTWTIECFECQLELTTAFIMEGNPGADKRKMLTLAVRRWNRRKKCRVRVERPVRRSTMTKGERMATPPWMPPEFGNDAVLIKALGDRINELCHQLEKVEHDRDRYSNRIAELDLLIQTAEDYAKAQDERMGKLVTALEEIAATEWYSEDHCIAEAEDMVRVAKLALKSA